MISLKMKGGINNTSTCASMRLSSRSWGIKVVEKGDGVSGREGKTPLLPKDNERMKTPLGIKRGVETGKIVLGGDRKIG